MLSERASDVKFEIGHVLFTDIVGYSKLLITEQSERLQTLKEIVRGTEQFHLAEAEGKLLGLPTGDGVALVFRTSPEAPVLCALEISKALKTHPELQVRMGVHSGPVNEITDLNEQANIAGAGINIAQRVMDCGDAGHILLSKRVADDLEQYPRWRPYLRELGECSVKHGVRLFVVNLYTDELGNPQQPKKIVEEQRTQRASMRRARPSFVGIIAILSLIALAIVAIIFAPAILRSWEKTQTKHPASATEASTTAIPEKSIAVLPFANLSDDKSNAYFADGIQDEILTKLSRIADLKVISRTSTARYKSKPEDLRTVARQLGVANILEGSVQRTADKVHVNVQLIAARTDAHLWAESYDRELKDVFAVESEVSQKIANSLQAKLSPAEKNAIEQRPTSDLTAFDQYSRAKTLILASSLGESSRKNLLQAIELLDSAVARDPSFYAAFCQLVFAHGQLYTVWGDHTPVRLAAADAALQQAIELRPNALETHLAHGAHLYRAFRDYKGALSELEAARAGLPNDPRIFELTGYILRRQDKYEEGTRALEQGVALDPRNPYTLTQLSFSYQGLRRYPEAKATLERVLEITPDDVSTASSAALVDLLWRADTAPLHQFIEQLRDERPATLADTADNWFDCALAERDWPPAEQALTALGNNPFWGDGGATLSRQFAEGLLARAMHDEARARKAFTAARMEQEQVVQKQKDYGPALCVLGLIDAALGNKEAALQEGRRAMELQTVEKDSFTAQALMAYFALIAAWAGEKDLALQQLATAAPTPGAALITSYGMLKLSPFWDPLRGDPRFEQIVASFAPKE
jgi:TolB-like protein/Tfp pilus assembly protein PilF